MKTDHIVDKRFKSAWKSVMKHLNFRDKYRLFNTAKFFRFSLDLTNVSKAYCKVYCVCFYLDDLAEGVFRSYFNFDSYNVEKKSTYSISI